MRVLGSNIPEIINFFVFFLLFFLSELKNKREYIRRGFASLIRFRNIHADSYMFHALMNF